MKNVLSLIKLAIISELYKNKKFISSIMIDQIGLEIFRYVLVLTNNFKNCDKPIKKSKSVGISF